MLQSEHDGQSRASGSPGQGLLVLVVEDSPQEALLLQEFLRRRGFEVEHAADGVTGIRMAEKLLPDLILLDLFLPEMDGIEVCRRLKAGFETVNIPIIMVSGQNKPDAIIQAFESGADDYVIKPMDLATLLARILANLRRTSRELWTNPLTRIPGIHFLHRRFPEMADRDPYICLALADIDNFKAYNDRYGFEAGDRVLQGLAEILRVRVKSLDPEGSLLVHVGGDDFIFVCTLDRVEQTCQAVLQDFDALAPGFYDDADRRRGFIRAVSRQGRTEEFPLMTLSIGVAPSTGARPATVTALGEAASEVKNFLKLEPRSTFMINRRSNR